MIKAFMFDLDGTLIDEQLKMSEMTIKTLKRLKEKGYILICNSGRPLFLTNYAIEPFLGENFFDYVYGNNGSEFYNCHTKEREFLHYLNPEQIKKVIDIYEDDMFTLGIYEETIDGNYIVMNKWPKEKEILDWIVSRGLKTKVVDFCENKLSYCKVICIHEKARYDEANNFIENHQIDFTTICHSSTNVIDVVPNGVSKGSSIKHFCNYTGIQNDEIIAFGDSSNDIPMLQACNGVLMGNAKDGLKDKIKTHTLSVKEDGVYHYLNNHHYLD